MTSTEGRLMIVLQGAIRKLKVQSEEELDEFLNHLADTFDERLRQSLLTWQQNRANPPKA